MRSTWGILVLMGGLGILLAPAEGDAAVVYRTSGAACQPRLGPGVFSPELGLVDDSASPVHSCALPTSDATFTPSTLTQVNIRYFLAMNGTVTGRLVFHDYDSHDFVECGEDLDVVPNIGYRSLEVTKSCSSSSYEDSWGVVPVVETTGLINLERIHLKLLTVYD